MMVRLREAGCRHPEAPCVRPHALRARGTDCMERAMQQSAVRRVGEWAGGDLGADSLHVRLQYKERQRKARCAVERRWPVYQLMRTLTHWALTGRYSHDVRLTKVKL